MARNNDFYDNYFEWGIDPRRRRIFLRGDIDEESIDRLIKSLRVLEDERLDPIEIWLSSYGGECDEQFAAYDVIRSMRSHIITVATGKIMSAAILIFAAGDERKCFPNTSFMIHQPSWDIEAKLAEHEVHINFAKEQDNRWAQCLASRTKKSAKQWLAMTRGKPDKYFDAITAASYGLVDEVLGEE